MIKLIIEISKFLKLVPSKGILKYYFMISAKILDVSTQVAGFSEKAISWFFIHGIKVLIVLFVAWLFGRIVKIFLSRVLRKAIKQSLDLGKKSTKAEEERAKTVSRVIISVVKAGIWAVALMTILPEFGINTAPLLASLGVMGLALSFGARSLIQDYFSGLFILLEDQYRVGESVEVAGAKGIVVDFNLRRTVIKSEDNNLHYVPNSQIKKASNFSRKQK